MAIKMRIKVGSVEIEYEGSEDFFKEEFPSIVKNFSQLSMPRVAVERDTTSTNEDLPDTDAVPMNNAPVFNMTTNNIAARLGVRSAADMVIAACAHLAFVRNKNDFTSLDILEEMKTAHAYYAASHRKNLQQVAE